MYYQLYLDSLFIQEVIVNFYVLNLCRICLMSTATQKRLILASLFAGAFQVLLFLISYPKNLILFYITVFVFYISGSFITVIIAFGRGCLGILIRRMIIHMTFLLAVGGIFMGFIPRLNFYKHSEGKIIIFLLAGALVYGLLWYLFKKRRMNAYYGQFGIMHNGTCIKGKYFMDSGNGLVESISKKPVLLAEEKWLFDIFAKEDLMSRPIVYKSVGKQKGILYAYCMDELVIYGETKEYTYEKVWVGVCREDLFRNRDYQIILPLFYGTHYE